MDGTVSERNIELLQSGHPSRKGVGGGRPNERHRQLVAAGLLDERQLHEAMAHQQAVGRPFIQAVIELGFVDEERIPEALALWHGLEHLDLARCEIDPEAFSAVPETIARRHGVVAVRFDGDALVIAVADPTDVVAVDDLRLITGRAIVPVVAGAAGIAEARDRMAAVDRSEVVDLDDPKDLPDDDDVLESLVEDAPVVRAVNRIVVHGVRQRASDIHIEPRETDVLVRYRIDGVLHEAARIPKSYEAGIVARIKVMADANITERRMPQDGRISVTVEGSKVDLRLATLPTVLGEEVVIRILDRGTSALSLPDLGYSPGALERYEEAVRKTYGLILVTGPTGSGKSTTLYATLNLINDPGKKIITVEDPVEYRLAGLRQIQVAPQVGLTFAAALRSILRCDPDNVMVGEIRDAETASIAIHAAMTGHLVLSTLHTNDASSAMTRLVEMGLQPFLVASSLNGVMAQRLARRLCSYCTQAASPSRDTEITWLEVAGEPAPQTVGVPVGCQYCANTGYRGRIALAEVLTVTDEIRALIAERRSSAAVREVALAQGMRPLLLDGIDKARDRITTLEEVLRVVG